MAGNNNSLAILFGSQTGNAEELAENTKKIADKAGLEAQVFDMDGFKANDLAKHKRIFVITSTWGEGEMPDNAEDLWGAVCDTLRLAALTIPFAPSVIPRMTNSVRQALTGTTSSTNSAQPAPLISNFATLISNPSGSPGSTKPFRPWRRSKSWLRPQKKLPQRNRLLKR